SWWTTRRPSTSWRRRRATSTTRRSATRSPGTTTARSRPRPGGGCATWCSPWAWRSRRRSSCGAWSPCTTGRRRWGRSCGAAPCPDELRVLAGRLIGELLRLGVLRGAVGGLGALHGAARRRGVDGGVLLRDLDVALLADELEELDVGPGRQVRHRLEDAGAVL